MNQWFEQKFSGGGIKKTIRKKKPSHNLSYTTILIAVNVIFFFGFIVLSSIFGNDLAVSWIALMPASILAGEKLWTFFTSMFMHGGFGHLFANMLSLMFIGNFVEKLVGKKRFIWLYLGGGFFASVLFILLAGIFGNTELGAKIVGSPLTYAVGASGAIFALGGLLAVLTPRLPVLVFFIIPMPMWAAMAFLMFGLWALSSSFGLPVGNTAHLGGLLVGVGYGLYLKKKFPRKTEMISKYFSR